MFKAMTSSPSLTLALGSVGATLAVAAAAFATLESVSAAGLAQETSCGASQIVIEGGRPAGFVLPDNRGETLEVDPDGIVTIRAENPPPDASVRWGVSGPGGLGEKTRPFGGAAATTVEVEDYSKYGRGLYDLDVALLSGGAEVCVTSFRLRITGFGGMAAVASIAATGAAGATALLTMMYTVNGTLAKLRLKVQVHRRRPTGWRKWVPVPAWKRTIFGTILGAITGLFVTALLQQAGFAPLSLASGVWALITGGSVAFGAGIALGAVWSYLRPPEAPEPAQQK